MSNWRAASRLWRLVLAIAAPLSADAALIEDYQDHLGPRFAKRQRQSTRYIIVHSTESSLKSALGSLSRGGHAHYLVARTGKIYRILSPLYRADHAGVSMWDGVRNLSDHALGIELEGFHDAPFAAPQYRSLRWLVRVLRRRFHISSRDVLEHHRVAYALPNRFHSQDRRGRKGDPGRGNFDRQRAGLLDEYAFDPDVAAGRLAGRPARRRGREVDALAPLQPRPSRACAGVVAPGRSAWSLVGARYRAATTLYVTPGAAARRGSAIRDWTKLPPGTKVCPGVPVRSPTRARGGF